MSTEAQFSALRQTHPPPKFSRYRSVRRAHGIDATSPPTLPFRIAIAPQDAPVARSPSRYHKKAKSADNAVETAAGQRIRPAAPLHSHSASLAALTGELYPSNNDALLSVPAPTKAITPSAQLPNASPAVAAGKVSQAPQSCFGADPTTSRMVISTQEMNEEAHEKLSVEEERIRRVKSKQSAAREFKKAKRMTSADKTQSDGFASMERDTPKEEISTTQSVEPILTRRREGRTQGPAMNEAENVSPTKIRSAVKNDTKTHEMRTGGRQEPVTAKAPPSPVQNLSSRGQVGRILHTRLPLPKQQLNAPTNTQPSKPSPPALEPSEPGPITSDIPRSAVNAGERRVVVKYDESVISLPLTPTTTPQDLLKSVSIGMSSRFDPQQSLLSESFTQLGLERPLRKYEHVRDVVNSWDYDAQNHLVVMTTSANVLSKGDVDPSALPKQPGGTSLYMYHSQRPGKWDKRWVSLKEDGQISISKRQDGSESSNLCHLSDFDIYKPTQRQMKKLRPPKKVCFAIKSQQKSVLFLNGANFVHFFATSDGPLTETWYSAVRTWRSWYLVNVLGEGQEPGSSHILNAGIPQGPIVIAPSTSEQMQPLPPRRGQQSTPGLSKAGSPTKTPPKTPPSKAIPRRDLREASLGGRGAPPSSFPSHQILQSDPSVPSSRTRRTPSLIKGGERTTSMRSDLEAPSSLRRSTSLSRAGSVRQVPKPLVDLTPQFQEQPQHLRKGRGVAPVPGKPLVELATDVEAVPGAITTPAARAWQRPQDTGIVDNDSDATAVKSSRGFAEPPNDHMAFTGTGLLSKRKSKRAQGGIGHGYGIKTGDRNHVGEPLVDLRIGSQFANGSLLRQVELFKCQDERGLIVDRAKRMEKDVRVGESF
jgi:hypothetical protein